MIHSENKYSKEQRDNNDNNRLTFQFVPAGPAYFRHFVIHVPKEFRHFLKHFSASVLGSKYTSALNESALRLIRVAGLEGLEPPTSGFGVRRTSQLCYRPNKIGR